MSGGSSGEATGMEGGGGGNQQSGESGNTGTGRSDRDGGHGCQRNRGSRSHQYQSRFEGREPTLKGFIYDFTGKLMPDQFIKTKKRLKPM
jgi:hypothetical protein